MSISVGTTRVLIVEDHVLFAKALAQVLAADPAIEVVEIATAAEATDFDADVDVLVIDCADQQHENTARRIKARRPHIRVCDLRKDSSPQELLAAVKRLDSGVRYRDGGNDLSTRERQIIALIAQGFSNRDIGQRLVLSEKTIKNHVSRIFTKIRCTARSQAAVHAIRAGLV